ncbi:MAG: hypothetical protein H7330_12440 [Hymenobacteraceae bacterium]|nr:hypothetical protein [Hymenobacteraceae bacterium]
MRLVLASVLKPVTDPRLLARLGRTLAELPGAEVHIVAHVAADAPTARPDTERSNVFLHPVFDFSRLSLARAQAGRTLLTKLRELRPDIVVIGAAELLPAGVQWQRQTGGQLVYDVRENYALNVRTQGVFPSLVAGRLAVRIARMAAAAAPHLAGALLAERVYAEQLPWLKDCRRVEIIENKYQPTSPIPNPPLRAPLTPDRPLRFLITGTLSELYGTFDAIMRLGWMQHDELHIVGHAPRPADAVELRRLAADRTWMKLTGIEQPVPHAVIVDAIRQADAGLLPYQPHPSLDGCIPTKFWEYQAEGLPLVQRLSDRWRTVYGTTSIVSTPDDPLAPLVMERAMHPGEPPIFSGFLRAIGQLPFGQAPPPPPGEAFWSASLAQPLKAGQGNFVSEASRLLAFFRALPQP